MEEGDREDEKDDRHKVVADTKEVVEKLMTKARMPRMVLNVSLEVSLKADRASTLSSLFLGFLPMFLSLSIISQHQRYLRLVLNSATRYSGVAKFVSELHNGHARL